MEWTVVTVIVVLAGLIASVVKPVLSLNSTITRLTESVNFLEKNIAGLIEKNDESHNRLWEKDSMLDERMNNHETRLMIIESR
ncbi:MAG TPA: hypothetical protein DD735_10240 [Clostridiales bacterium]|nr:hypothetical protein [Clostridiales bacterium]